MTKNVFSLEYSKKKKITNECENCIILFCWKTGENRLSLIKLETNGKKKNIFPIWGELHQKALLLNPLVQ